jgi:hypothetical protein
MTHSRLVRHSDAVSDHSDQDRCLLLRFCLSLLPSSMFFLTSSRSLEAWGCLVNPLIFYVHVAAGKLPLLCAEA